MEEIFEVVDEYNNIIGTAKRSECHGNPNLIHRTAHVVVRNSHGDFLLQKRSCTKDIQPGKWDTAVGGHLAVGEDFLTAAKRELNEELGLDPDDFNFSLLFELKERNSIESENTYVYAIECEGPFNFQKSEIDEVKFWSIEEIKNSLNKEILTPMCERELKNIISL